jgi:hypothetical protein
VIRRSGEAGFMTVQYVAATCFTLVLLLFVANLLVDLYARGVVREALDEGVRAAVPVDAAAGACETRAHEVLSGLLRGPAGAGVTVQCNVDAGAVHAHATVTMRSWLPSLLPAWRFHADASASRAT